MSDSDVSLGANTFDVETLNSPGFHRFFQTMGIHADSIEAGECRLHMELKDDYLHPGQVIHGGIAFSLGDSAMALALVPTLVGEEHCYTVDAHISYLSAVKDGRLDCVGTVRKRGRSVAFTEARITQGDTLVATMSGTFSITSLR